MKMKDYELHVPIKQMAATFKKKWEFFNRGKGIDSYDESEASENSSPSPQEILKNHYESSSSGIVSITSSNEYLLLNSPCEEEKRRDQSFSYMHSEKMEFDNLNAHVLPHDSSSFFDTNRTTAYMEPNECNNVYQRLLPQERDGKNPRKRQQRCRLCANHRVITDVKGHKWYCRYRACKCNQCFITKKRQFYMKEQQKLTRLQISKENTECNFHNLSLEDKTKEIMTENVPSRKRSDNLFNYPRIDELDRETADIIDADLFDRINQVCRPKASLHH